SVAAAAAPASAARLRRGLSVGVAVATLDRDHGQASLEGVRQGDGPVAGVDLVPALLLEPLARGRHHVHVLDDLPPAYPGIVRAEGDLALLRPVRDHAHLGAAEVVGPQVLEPHAPDPEELPVPRGVRAVGPLLAAED